MHKNIGRVVASKCIRLARYFIVTAALSSAALFAQRQEALNAMLNVVAQPSAEALGHLEVMVTNNSGRSIAAYNIDVIERSRSGMTRTSNLNLDLLPSYASVSRSPLVANKYQYFGPLKAGNRLFQLLGAKYAPDSQITANVTTIIFDDNTVAGDRTWAQFVFDQHSGAAAELDALVGMLKGPYAMSLREQIKTWRQKVPQHGQLGESVTPLSRGTANGVGFAKLFVTSKLTEVSRESLEDTDVSDQFKKAISYFSDTANDMRMHSSLVEVAQ